jgi:hypothetical protein
LSKVSPVVSCVFAAIAVAACQREATRAAPRTAVVTTVSTPVRISMDALHQAGGVPPGWVFSLPRGDPQAGREVFVDYGCPSCHVVEGEPFSLASLPPGNAGPELTGMGSHHPVVYFVESLLNPDAILVEGPGFIGADGRSTMPAYPDLTAEQLTDLVAYLRSLTDAESHAAGAATFTGRADVEQRNLPPDPGQASPPSEVAADPRSSVFFVQTFRVRDGRLAALERWFAASGQPAFLSFEGLLELETHVDRTRGPESLVTVFGFSDMEALRQFLADERVAAALDAFDEFAEVAERQVYEQRPVYRVGALSSG